MTLVVHTQLAALPQGVPYNDLQVLIQYPTGDNKATTTAFNVGLVVDTSARDASMVARLKQTLKRVTQCVAPERLSLLAVDAERHRFQRPPCSAPHIDAMTFQHDDGSHHLCDHMRYFVRECMANPRAPTLLLVFPNTVAWQDEVTELTTQFEALGQLYKETTAPLQCLFVDYARTCVPILLYRLAAATRSRLLALDELDSTSDVDLERAVTQYRADVRVRVKRVSIDAHPGCTIVDVCTTRPWHFENDGTRVVIAMNSGGFRNWQDIVVRCELSAPTPTASGLALLTAQHDTTTLLLTCRADNLPRHDVRLQRYNVHATLRKKITIPFVPRAWIERRLLQEHLRIALLRMAKALVVEHFYPTPRWEQAEKEVQSLLQALLGSVGATSNHTRDMLRTAMKASDRLGERADDTTALRIWLYSQALIWSDFR